MPSTTTYYDVLDVDEDVGEEAIRDAYREKVKEYHPDVSDHPDAEERFKAVKRAEVVLTDPEERTRYDRLGHEQYVEGAPYDDAPDGAASGDDIRDAAARAAEGPHDAGGPTAGWRDRERRAYREATAYWAETGTGPFGEGSEAGHDDPFAERDSPGPGAAADPTPGATESPSGRGGSTGESGDGPGATVGDPDANAATANASDPPPGYAAADGWGGTSAHSGTHSVADWRQSDPTVDEYRPTLSQDDVVLLGATMALYPILLYLTVASLLPLVANVAIGLVTFTLVAFLLPRPTFAIPVFGVWSVLVPVGMAAHDVSLFSLAGLVALTGVWLPLFYSVSVAVMLAR